MPSGTAASTAIRCSPTQSTRPPLPAGHESHEPLRLKVNAYLENGQGGVIAIRCPGGTRGLALVYTKRDNERGYDLITIYDDGP